MIFMEITNELIEQSFKNSLFYGSAMLLNSLNSICGNYSSKIVDENDYEIIIEMTPHQYAKNLSKKTINFKITNSMFGNFKKVDMIKLL